MCKWIVGLSEKKMDPPAGYPMAGYILRDDLSSGIHDDLFIRAVSIRVEDKIVLIIECDLLGVRKDWADEVSKKISKLIGIPTDDIYICCTHTHSAPDSLGRYDRGSAFSKWMIRLEADIIDCSAEALNNEFPAGLSMSSGAAGFQVNRVISACWGGLGKQSWEMKNWDDRPKEEITIYEKRLKELQTSNIDFLDDNVIVLRIWDANDKRKTKAVLVNYPCHPVTLGPNNSKYSADYPGEMRKALLKEWPDAIIMFMNGCCGDINPNKRNGFESSGEIGRRLSVAVLKAVKETEKVLKPFLENTKYPVCINYDLDYDMAELERRLNHYKQGYKESSKQGLHEEEKIYRVYISWAEKMLAQWNQNVVTQAIEINMGVIKLGEMNLVMLPFEVFSGIGKAIKEKMAAVTMIVAYAGGDCGYLISEALYDVAKYERQESYKFMCIPGPAARNAQEVIIKTLNCSQ